MPKRGRKKKDFIALRFAERHVVLDSVLACARGTHITVIVASCISISAWVVHYLLITAVATLVAIAMILLLRLLVVVGIRIALLVVVVVAILAMPATGMVVLILLRLLVMTVV